MTAWIIDGIVATTGETIVQTGATAGTTIGAIAAGTAAAITAIIIATLGIMAHRRALITATAITGRTIGIGNVGIMRRTITGIGSSMITTIMVCAIHPAVTAGSAPTKISC